LFDESWSRAMNRVTLLEVHWTAFVDGIAGHIEYATEDAFADGNRELAIRSPLLSSRV
jgi:hypothetical protein